MSNSDRERLQQLLADRATQGLSDAQWTELEQLLDAVPDENPESWDLAAAWVDTALVEAQTPELEPLPAHLQKQIVAQGRLAVRAQGTHSDSREPASRQSAPTPAQTPAPAGSGLGWFGYAAAAAAGVVLTLLFLAETPIDPERGYQRLVASSEDLVEATFDAQPGNGLDNVTGTVIWSDEIQQGYLRLTGMPKNDPTAEQYQLWIVDADQKHPVDGGVFDVTVESGEVIIPIDAKLTVDDPTTFVLTTELPGGVPVSDGPFQAVATTGA